MAQIGVLLSGRGANFLAIANAIERGEIPGARIAAVLSNVDGAPGIKAAEARGLHAATVASLGRKRAEHDAEMVLRLRDAGADLICLAGYMRLLSPGFVDAFPQKILNIHPSLLPAFPGLDAQRQALAYGVRVTGCTVHFVDKELDHGPIVLQRTVPVLDTDDEAVLSARILEQEHEAYPQAIARVLSGRYHFVDRRYVLRDLPAAAAQEAR